MNNRDYKQFVPNSIYHIYNRGVGKMDIFLDEDDYKFFLKRIREALFPTFSEEKTKKTMGTIACESRRSQLPDDAFDLIAYCIMPNHFHFVVRQNTDLSISILMSKLCTSYSKYFNKKYERVGSLYQDQFKAVLVESNEQLLYLIAYVHRNPLKAKIVKDLKNYLYSSHLDYLGKRGGALCKKDLILGQYISVNNYVKSVMEFDDNKITNELGIDIQ